MGAVAVFSVLSNLVPEQFVRYAGAWISSLTQEFNGNIEFVKNIRASGILAVSFVGTEVVKVEHTLQRVPSGFLLIKMTDGNATIRSIDSDPQKWTDKVIYLQATATNNAFIYVI